MGESAVRDGLSRGAGLRAAYLVGLTGDRVENLKLSQLYIGKTDAKDELIFGNEDERLLFERTFFTPPNFRLEDFENGRRFYVMGLKGAGKTALLRYLDIVLKRKPGAQTNFILFKSDISNDDLKELSRADDSITVVDAKPSKEDFDHDYENVWRWFLHRHVVDTLERKDSQVVVRDDAYERYVACVKAADIGDARSGIRKLFPKFTKGQVEISRNPSLKIEFEWSDAQKTKVPLPALVRQLDNLFCQLRHNSGSMFIFVDEIELRLGAKKQYERDCQIIRDLIVSVHKFNQFSQQHGRWLKLIAAIRSEVLSVVMDFGKEIEKPISDFGQKLSWYEKVPEEGLHLLAQMICYKIHKTETGLLGARPESSDEIWARYFKSSGSPLEQKVLLHKTWFRPRDLVRICKMMQEKWPDRREFTAQMISDCMKDYSTESWREIIGEMAVKYNAAQQRAVSLVLNRFQTAFTLNEFTARIDRLVPLHSDVRMLVEAFRPADVLTDLYRVGAIGNVEKGGVRFAFRDTGDIDFTSRIGMHQGLWPHFNVFPNSPGSPRRMRSYASEG